jgi:hypothetical protein
VLLLLTPLGRGATPPPPIPLRLRRGTTELNPNPTPGDNVLKFDVQTVSPGRYRLRLRVDVVDSLPMRRTADGTSVELDDNQEVQI